ncbi:PREDICTED: neuropeptide Y receptor-like, partial [Priapulus caudatus]|uniref:Neuropeptide Y receptor-like n=1 Tax=Priapulus caudatus TaxID=37621 RepID=A0ABM1F2R1_PRICU
TALVASVITLTTISIDRFFAVFWPLKVRITQQRASIVIVATWLLAAATSFPLLIYRQYKEIHWLDYVERVCWEKWPSTPVYDESCRLVGSAQNERAAYYTFMTIALFFFPMIVITLAYSLIVWKLCVSIVPGEQHSNTLQLQARAKRKHDSMTAVTARQRDRSDSSDITTARHHDSITA